jgi:hypothetical protein
LYLRLCPTLFGTIRAEPLLALAVQCLQVQGLLPILYQAGRVEPFPAICAYL